MKKDFLPGAQTLLPKSLFAITLGEPKSINIRALAQSLPQKPPMPVILIGSYEQWVEQVPASSFLKNISSNSEFPSHPQPGYYFVTVTETAEPQATLDLSKTQRGLISVKSLQKLAEIPNDVLIAVLTAPISKENCYLAGFSYPGQTEFFEDLWNEKGIMVLSGPRLTVGLATNHVPLLDVPNTLSIELIVRKARSLAHTIKSITGKSQLKIAVCGLNPHAGENGHCGTEEISLITPALKQLRNSAFCEFYGPVPADTAFYRCTKGEFDGVLAMYHDQALGPLKTIHFDDAINITGGLKNFRCSPDHGPAEDKWQSSDFSSLSFKQAIKACFKYLGH